MRQTVCMPMLCKKEGVCCSCVVCLRTGGVRLLQGLPVSSGGALELLPDLCHVLGMLLPRSLQRCSRGRELLLEPPSVCSAQHEWLCN